MLGIFSGQRPDITPIQVLAGIVLALNLAGLITLDTEQATGLVAFVLGDTGLRAARNAKDAKVEAAAVASPAEPHDLVLPDGEAESEFDLADAIPEGDEPAEPAVVQPSQIGPSE